MPTQRLSRADRPVAQPPLYELPLGKAIENVLIAALLLLVSLLVLAQANPLTRPMGRDSGIYAYVASSMLKGGTPYLTASERKTPGIFFIDAIALSLGHGGRWGIWFIEFAFLIGAVLAGFHALQRTAGRGPATLASLLWLLGLSPVLQGGNFTEEYSLLFGFASVCLYLLLPRKHNSLWLHAVLGLLFGCSFLLRPNNVGVQVSILVCSLLVVPWRQRSLPGTVTPFLATSIGFALPVAGVCTYLSLNNALQAFWEAAFVYSFSYAGGIDLGETVLRGFRYVGIPAFLGVLGVGWVALDEARTRINGGGASRIGLWLCLDFVIEILFSALSGRNYRHYFISWLPWIAFGCGLLFFKAFGRLASRSSPLTLPVLFAVLLALGGLFSNTLRTYHEALGRLIMGNSGIQLREAVPEYVRKNTLPSDLVLVWGGQAGINFLAERESPTAYFFYPLFVPSVVTDRMSEHFYRDIQAHPPVLIVDPAAVIGVAELVPLSVADPLSWTSSHGVYAPAHLAEFFAFLDGNYLYEANVDGMAIYRLQR